MDRATALAKLDELRPGGVAGGLRTQGTAVGSGAAVSPQPTFGFGLAPGSSATDFRIAVRVQDARLMDGARMRAIADHVGGEVDVQYIGLPSPFSAPTVAPTDRVRPVVPGCSIAPVTTDGAGTLGCFVVDDEGHYALSNSHVFTDHGSAATGTGILQPSRLDGGDAASDVVATLARAVDMDVHALNVADCAIAKLDPIDADPTIPGIGRPSTQPQDADLGLDVTKRGRTSDVTLGVVTALHVNLKFQWPQGLMELADLVEMKAAPGTPAFAGPGDSGSLIVAAAGFNPIGLLVGGGPDAEGRITVYATPIQTVLDELGVTLA